MSGRSARAIPIGLPSGDSMTRKSAAFSSTIVVPISESTGIQSNASAPALHRPRKKTLPGPGGMKKQIVHVQCQSIVMGYVNWRGHLAK